MKKISLLIFILSTFSVYCQSKGKYLINKSIEITRITFEKNVSNVYSKKKEKKLTSLEFSLRTNLKATEKECFLIRHYDNDRDIDIKNYKKLEELKEKVDVEYFYKLVDVLNNMNTDVLNENSNVMDGKICKIHLSDKNYRISFGDNWEDETTSEFYNLFHSVWNKYNQ